jgi:hypothetical protein
MTSGIVIKGEHRIMSKNEMELFKIIYENDNPEQSVQTAITVFAAFLERLEADQGPRLVCSQESA